MFQNHLREETERSVRQSERIETGHNDDAKGRYGYRGRSQTLLREQALAAILLVSAGISAGVGLLFGPWWAALLFVSIFVWYGALAVLQVRRSRRSHDRQLAEFERRDEPR